MNRSGLFGRLILPGFRIVRADVDGSFFSSDESFAGKIFRTK